MTSLDNILRRLESAALGQVYFVRLLLWDIIDGLYQRRYSRLRPEWGIWLSLQLQFFASSLPDPFEDLLLLLSKFASPLIWRRVRRSLSR